MPINVAKIGESIGWIGSEIIAAFQSEYTGPIVSADKTTTTYMYSHHRNSVLMRLDSICIDYKSTQAPLVIGRLKV